jgi:hypothetical protein
VPGTLPHATIVPMAIGAASMADAIRTVEARQFDERAMAVAPAALDGFRSATGRVTSYRREGQTIHIHLATSGPVLLMVNETFFESWVAKANDQELSTVPLNVDRLGIVVPERVTHIVLKFGRHRLAVAAAWAASALLLILLILGRPRDDRQNEELA